MKVTKWDEDMKKTSPTCESGYSYKTRNSFLTPQDQCEKGSSKRDPVCPKGYDYIKRDTKNAGKDECWLKGIAELEVDVNEGF